MKGVVVPVELASSIKGALTVGCAAMYFSRIFFALVRPAKSHQHQADVGIQWGHEYLHKVANTVYTAVVHGGCLRPIGASTNTRRRSGRIKTP